jgi:hypothetical protein
VFFNAYTTATVPLDGSAVQLLFGPPRTVFKENTAFVSRVRLVGGNNDSKVVPVKKECEHDSEC